MTGERDVGAGLSRRDLLARLGVAGAAIAAFPSVLAACGDDDDNEASTGTGATNAPAASGGGAAAGDAGARLAEMLQVDPANAGRGQNWTIGAVLALSGNGSYYGKTMTRGIDLAVKHITAAGAGWDGGEPTNSISKEASLKYIADAGYEFNGLYELFTPNTTDFASVLPEIKANEPDLLTLGAWGQDPGAFMNQAQPSGIKSLIIGFELTPDGINASRGAYEPGWSGDVTPQAFFDLNAADFKMAG